MVELESMKLSKANLKNPHKHIKINLIHFQFLTKPQQKQTTKTDNPP